MPVGGMIERASYDSYARVYQAKQLDHLPTTHRYSYDYVCPERYIAGMTKLVPLHYTGTCM